MSEDSKIFMLEERTEVIRKIIERFGTANLNIMASLKFGESLAEYLKEQAVIYPFEYDKLLENKTENFIQLVDSLNQITSLINEKSHLYELYCDYCRLFLGSDVSYIDLTISKYHLYSHLDLRDESGFIDYTPYLNNLDIINIDDLHPGLKDLKRKREK